METKTKEAAKSKTKIFCAHHIVIYDRIIYLFYASTKKYASALCVFHGDGVPSDGGGDDCE